MEFRRLFPEPGALELNTLRESLEFSPHHDRPHTLANFVASVDGRAAVGGRSAPLSSEGDRALFHLLRERVDAIVAGTSTLRTERYGRLIKDPEARARRVRNGLAPEPLACIVTRSGRIPTEIPLFSEASESRIVVFSGDASRAETPAPDVRATVGIVRLDPEELTLPTVTRRLHDDYGVRSLLCEGGPTLFGALLAEGLVDELFLTIAPRLVGGVATTITPGAELSGGAPVRLRWVLEHDQSLFLRLDVSAPAA